MVTAAATSGPTCELTDDAVTDDGVGWIDGSSTKRWTSFAGDFNGNEIDPTPSAFQIVIYPADQGDPPATELADPSLGFVKNIVDNGDDWIEVFDDGELFLNGKVIADYVGYQYKIIRRADHAKGYGWVDRYPPKPNDAERHCRRSHRRDDDQHHRFPHRRRRPLADPAQIRAGRRAGHDFP